MKLVFATNNSNKIKEVSNLTSNQIEIISLKDIGCNEDIVESEDTIIAVSYTHLRAHET